MNSIDVMEYFVIYCICLLVTRYVTYGATTTYANETALRSLLKTGYDTTVPPYRPTLVTVRHNIRFMASLDISSQSMSHTGWLEMNWTDTRLTWDPTAYDNITTLSIDWAWRPIMTLNGYNKITKIGYVNDEFRVTVRYDGITKAIWDGVMVTPCEIRVRNFPFDTQTCKVEITSFDEDYFNTLLFDIDERVGVQNLLENGEWQFQSASTDLVIVPFTTPFSSNMAVIRVTLSFDRLRTFYVINLILPANLLSVCMVLAFILPTECGERLGFTLTIMLSYTVTLTITTDMLPTTSIEVPYIGQYLLIILIICTLITCHVGMHVKMYFKEDIPSRFSRTVYTSLKPIIFLEIHKLKRTKVKDVQEEDRVPVEDYQLKVNQYTETMEYSKNRKNGNDVDKTSHDSDVTVTWKDISILSDRICLYVYSIAVVACTVWLIQSLNQEQSMDSN